MKKKYIILIVLLVSVVLPVQLFAQSATQFPAQNVASTDVFKQEGIASWYGREFEGRPTASGEIFDASQLTAAHPSLPFGTRLIVTNQHNNKSVTVRVNDRGPFVPARIIDISRAAAEQLDMIVTGTAPVSVVSIDRIIITTPAVGAQMAPQSIPSAPQAMATPVQPASTVKVLSTAQESAALPQSMNYAQPASAAQSQAPVYVTQPVVMQLPSRVRLTPDINIETNKNYRLQVGSFKNAKNAVDAFDRLKSTGLNPAYERFTASDNSEYYRVVVAGVRGTDVQLTTDRINAAGFKEAIIREEN